MLINEVKKAHGLYLCGMSIAKVAARFSVSRQSLHYYFKSEGLKTRPPKRYETQVYNGRTFAKRANGYWIETKGEREMLHRLIWKDTFGDIPAHNDIRFLDGNKDNLDVNNLEMISKSDHVKLNCTRKNQYIKRWPERYEFEAVKCNSCGNILTKKDSPHFRKRKFCGRTCHASFLKGKEKGTKAQVIKC